MKIAVGADHGGYKLKTKLIKFLEYRGYEIADLGTHSAASCDYPAIGYKVAISVSNKQFSRGILVCKSGIGLSIVANKVPGIRAALCQNRREAKLSREHNNANVLSLAGSNLSLKKASLIVETWLKTEFAGGRHARRVKQITNIEKKIKMRSAVGVNNGTLKKSRP